MSGEREYLFLGGQEDGRRRVVQEHHHAWLDLAKPKDGVHIDGPVNYVHYTRLNVLGCLVFVPQGWTPADAARVLIQGYRRPQA